MTNNLSQLDRQINRSIGFLDRAQAYVEDMESDFKKGHYFKGFIKFMGGLLLLIAGVLVLTFGILALTERIGFPYNLIGRIFVGIIMFFFVRICFSLNRRYFNH